VRPALKVRENCFAAGLSAGVTIALVGATFIGSIGAAFAECKPSHLKALYFLRTMGPCEFNSETLSFRGTPAQQAMCLMRGMDATRNLAPVLKGLPPGLAKRIGETTGLPSREALSAYLSKLDLEWDFAIYLWQPVSRAHDNAADAPTARYFVIHDTSGPFYGHRAFPDDVNTNPKINNLKRFVCNDEWGKAHVVINRLGDSLVDHDFSIPWRETKFEQAAEFGGALKGLFVHVEMIQPRRAGPGRGDGHSPDPAFTPAQYDRLALLYTIVSVRAGRWLIPAFHAAIDADIRNGHDDPLNFKVDSFADSIDRLIEQLQGSGQSQASNATPASDTAPGAAPATSGGFWIDALWGTPHKSAVAMAAAGTTSNPPQPNGEAVSDSATVPQADAGGADASGAPAAPNIPAVAGVPAVVADKPPAAHEPVAHGTVAHKPAAAGPARREKVAERESPSSPEEKSAELCATHRTKGHLQRVCGPAQASAQDHPQEPGQDHAKSARRPADRDASRHKDGDRPSGTAQHPRHDAGASPRHRRS
jgi:hypothetical protein